MIDFKKYGIPEDYTSASMEDIHKTIQYGADLPMKLIRDSRALGLVFMGINGSGKTYASCAMIMEYMRYMNRLAYRGTMRELFSSYKENDWRIPAKYMQPSLLIIDEVGKEGNVAKHSSPILEELIQWRIEKHKKTVLVMNMTLGEFQKHYENPTIMSNIRGSYKMVVFNDEDLRA